MTHGMWHFDSFKNLNWLERIAVAYANTNWSRCTLHMIYSKWKVWLGRTIFATSFFLQKKRSKNRKVYGLKGNDLCLINDNLWPQKKWTRKMNAKNHCHKNECYYVNILWAMIEPNFGICYIFIYICTHSDSCSSANFICPLSGGVHSIIVCMAMHTSVTSYIQYCHFRQNF